MKAADIKVGQTVLHNKGFVAEVVAVNEPGHYPEAVLKVLHVGSDADGFVHPDYEYKAKFEYIKEVIVDVPEEEEVEDEETTAFRLVIPGVFAFEGTIKDFKAVTKEMEKLGGAK